MYALHNSVRMSSDCLKSLGFVLFDHENPLVVEIEMNLTIHENAFLTLIQGKEMDVLKRK
jgi:hypothetical protein